MFPTRMDATTADLGDDVIYAVGRSATRTLLVLNNRPITHLNLEQALDVIELGRTLRMRERREH